jgi:hypothetical protein
MQLTQAQPSSPSSFGGRQLLYLGLLFLLALLPRLYSVAHLGWNWDSPGSFTLVNFDEGGSCRAALEGFDYSTFIGRQTIAVTKATGAAPPTDISGDARAVKAYCHSPQHLRVARSYSAITGALTSVVLAVIALLLVPAQPAVAWTAGALLALSGFHISESHSGTVDAPSVFYIYTFLAVMVFSVGRKKKWGLLASPLLLIPAVWTKYWVFALFSYVAVFPIRAWQYCIHGMSSPRIVLLVVATAVLFSLLTNHDFQRVGLYPLLAAWYLVIPWRAVRRPMIIVWLLVPPLAWLFCSVDVVASYTTGGEFGTGYAAIGWHKWLRNLINLPVVLIVGLGLPACLFIPAGIRALVRQASANRAWVCLTPVLVFALYMAFLAPVTYYRHYLPLLPAAALLAALGLYATRWAGRRWFLALFFIWPALLAVDMVTDYHQDPRIELRQWYRDHPDARVFFSYYVNPPQGNNRLFQPQYAAGDAAVLRQATHLILSENWYDTAFANELNGPLIGDTARLIKTTPDKVRFYRDALTGSQPHLEEEQIIAVNSFMPELLLHRRFYGNFQLFVGDLVIFRVLN